MARKQFYFWKYFKEYFEKNENEILDDEGTFLIIFYTQAQK